MALATILGLYFPRSRWLFWAIGAWAALGRVTMDRHFLSDVVFGAGLGIACVLVWAECLGPGRHRFR
jgi:membrane-associated phospholipid phosphatase